MPPRHVFTNPHADSLDTTLTRASDWNAAHTNRDTLLAVVGSYSILTTDELLLCTAGASGFAITLPTAVGIAGQSFKIKRVDAGVGLVTVATTSAQTIDGAASYALQDQWQYVVVQSDGANWLITGNN